jgi:hypothetical protein
MGNYQGPFFPDESPKGSVWYWNLAEAAKKEDIKYCKRLNSCRSMNAFNAGGTRRCGFCPWDLQRGVPVDSAGNALYPGDVTASCDTMVTQDNQCPTPGETRDGSVATGATSPTSVCDQRDGAGNITSACIVRLGQQAGMSLRGGYLSAVSKGTTSPQLGYAMDVVLASYKTNDLYKDPAKALQYFMRIVQAQTTGATQSIRNAATYVSSDTNVDFCPTDSNSTGPFDLPCMQRAFREKGCQPAGSSYPKTSSDATAASLMSWGDLNTKYTGIKLATQSSDPTVQRPALKQCLGIDMPLPPPPSCDTFNLQSFNFPDRVMMFPGQGGQVRIDVSPPSSASTLTLKTNKDGTVQIVPASAPNLVFRHRGYTLHADPNNATDSLLLKDSSFYVRAGNADKSKVSFESLNFPGFFLRHAGFRLFLHRKDGSDIFNKDSTFTLNKDTWDVLNQPNTTANTWNEMNKICTDRGQRLCTSKEMCPSNKPIANKNIFGGNDNWIAVSDKPNEWLTYATFDNRLCKTHTQVANDVPSWGTSKNGGGWYRAGNCCPRTG